MAGSRLFWQYTNCRWQVLSVVNVSVLLAAEQQLHPHDAILLANGDMVVATWAPGRVSYVFKFVVLCCCSRGLVVDCDGRLLRRCLAILRARVRWRHAT